MINVSESEGKYVSRKKNITVKDVFIVNNTLVDVETGETDVLNQLAEEIPDGVDRFKFKLSFELLDEE